jgi:nucleotide sugar dehydrogenase
VTEYLWHGLGFGGSCFPKDVEALRGFGRAVGEQTRILDAVLQINEDQPLRMVSLLKKEMVIPGKRVAVLGLAFKPGTDDLRESPALPLVAELLKEGAMVVAHDPIALPQARRHPDFAGVQFVESWMAALEDSDACCVVTAWPEYRFIHPAEFAKRMRRPLLIDGRGIYDPAPFTASGVIWRGVGYTPESA